MLAVLYAYFLFYWRIIGFWNESYNAVLQGWPSYVDLISLHVSIFKKVLSLQPLTTLPFLDHKIAFFGTLPLVANQNFASIKFFPNPTPLFTQKHTNLEIFTFFLVKLDSSFTSSYFQSIHWHMQYHDDEQEHSSSSVIEFGLQRQVISKMVVF